MRCIHCCMELYEKTQEEHNERCSALWIINVYAAIEAIEDPIERERELRSFDNFLDNDTN